MRTKQINKANEIEKTILEFFDKKDLFVIVDIASDNLQKVSFYDTTNENRIILEYRDYGFRLMVEDVQTQTRYHSRVKDLPEISKGFDTEEDREKWEVTFKRTFKNDDLIFERAEETSRSCEFPRVRLSGGPKDELAWK